MEYEYTVPEQLPEKITVEAEFKQIYTVNLAYSEAGEIVPIENEKPENCPEMGEVEVLKEEVTSLCAVPFENYCISGVFLDGKAVEPEKLEFDENGSLTFELSEENAENDIRIEFSAIEYSIEAEEAENGYIEIAKDYAESGKSAEVCIKPENGWYISRIYVNDVEVSVKRGNIEENFVVTDYKSGSFLIDKIKTDITVRAEFEEISNIPNINHILHFEYIQSLYPSAVSGDRLTIHPLELDIFIPELKVGIEYGKNFFIEKADVRTARRANLLK